MFSKSDDQLYLLPYRHITKLFYYPQDKDIKFKIKTKRFPFGQEFSVLMKIFLNRMEISFVISFTFYLVIIRRM